MSNPYRKRYVLDADGKFVEKSEAVRGQDGVYFVPDIRPFVTQDGVEISSRAALRAYERKNGVRQCGDDWTGSEKPAWWDSTMAKLKEQRR